MFNLVAAANILYSPCVHTAVLQNNNTIQATPPTRTSPVQGYALALAHNDNYFSDISSSSGGALGSAPTYSGGPSVLLCADGVFLLDFTCVMKTDRKSTVLSVTGNIKRDLK